MEEMARQQFMQTLMAYALLASHGGPMLVSELDDACEDFLVAEFDHRIDFQVEDALPRLERWGLVSRAGDVSTFFLRLVSRGAGAGVSEKAGGGQGPVFFCAALFGRNKTANPPFDDHHIPQHPHTARATITNRTC